MVLGSGRDRPLHFGHPWVFDGSVQRVDDSAAPGAFVEVATPSGRVVGEGFFNPASGIRVRLVENGSEGPGFWADGVARAWERRRALGFGAAGGGFRLAYSESDGLPGLTVDVFGSVAVVQSEIPGADPHLEAVADRLMERVPGLSTVFERSDTESRRREGLEPRVRLLAGEALHGPVFFQENGWPLIADPQRGQKTGAYLDLRDARILWTPLLAGRTVLDVCCYAGALSCLGLIQGARHALQLDQGEHALELAAAQAEMLGISDRREGLRANLFEALPTLGKEGRTFGCVILDPPRLAASRAQVADALRTLERLLRNAISLVEPDGLLMVFSCTGLLMHEPFEPLLEAAAHKAGRKAVLLDRIAQPADHPVPLTFPEAAYLKGLLLRIE